LSLFAPEINLPPSFLTNNKITINKTNKQQTSNMVVGNNQPVVIALTAEEMLRKGLILAGWQPERQAKVRVKKI
jgi:hypothetical protein